MADQTKKHSPTPLEGKVAPKPTAARTRTRTAQANGTSVPKTKPRTGRGKMTAPPAIDSLVRAPATAKPVAAKPAPARPVAAEPAPAKPVAAKPAPAKPVAAAPPAPAAPKPMLAPTKPVVRLTSPGAPILHASRAAGLHLLDAYECGFLVYANYQDRLAATSPVAWMSDLGRARAELTRRTVRLSTGTARRLLSA